MRFDEYHNGERAYGVSAMRKNLRTWLYLGVFISFPRVSFFSLPYQLKNQDLGACVPTYI